MRTPFKLAAFGGVVAVVFAGALGVGAAAGSPIESGSTPQHGPGAGHSTPGDGHNASTGAGGDHGAEHGSNSDAANGDAQPGGLQVSDRGYTLELAEPALPAGEAVDVAFQVTEDGGQPLLDYAVSHDKAMHLILVRRDGTGFQHVHPQLAPDGTWSTPVALTPGAWRVFTDFVPAAGPAPDQTLTLGADLSVAGIYDPAPLPQPSRTSTVDGYQVTLDGDLTPGQERPLTLTVSRDGQPVTDLQPYLGAYGHLVALRAGDLAYLHVHPDGEPGDGSTEPGPDVTFYATAPSQGTYRLFLDFQHQGQVRTAEFTVAAGPRGAAPATPSEPASPSAEHGSDGHDH